MANLKSRLKNLTKQITKSGFFINLLGMILYAYSRLVYNTVKWKISGRDEMIEMMRNNQNIILIAWHGRALMLPAFQKGYTELDALVSLHNDGRIIAGLLRRYNLGIIGGSSNNNARGAAVNLMHSLESGRSVCIIPDGPRGPRMKMTMSPIYYAWKTGCPIIAAAYSVDKCKIIESAWDKMLIPAPFCNGRAIFTEPFYIPADAKEDELDKYRLIIENKLNEINFAADKDCGLKPIMPSDEIKTKRKAPAEGDR